ncbi:MAG: sulfurtransferase [Gammaproteobacteria bacterium]|nr:sulfurtransferase [Gammaproteobacteria bacterium]
MDLGEISPQTLMERLTREPPKLIDVREPWEFELCRIAGAINVPLQTLPARLPELEQSHDIVVICHHGMRSLYAAEFLRDQGFSSVLNLTGGIARWGREIDPGMPQY